MRRNEVTHYPNTCIRIMCTLFIHDEEKYTLFIHDEEKFSSSFIHNKENYTWSCINDEEKYTCYAL